MGVVRIFNLVIMFEWMNLRFFFFYFLVFGLYFSVEMIDFGIIRIFDDLVIVSFNFVNIGYKLVYILVR